MSSPTNAWDASSPIAWRFAPVACFYELDGQVVIHAEDCIDCTACVAECPVEAIYAEADVPEQFKAGHS